MKTDFPTTNSWKTQSSLYSQKTWGGVWVVIAISSSSHKFSQKISTKEIDSVKAGSRFHF